MGNKMKYLIFLLVLLTPVLSTYAQWQKQLSGTSEDLNDVDVLNQTTAIVVGNNGIILKTTNNGLNWILKNSGTTSNLNAVSFRDDQNGLVVGDGVLCRTTDGGESWLANSFYKNGATVCYRFRFFNSSSHIIIGSDDGTIIFSSDDGNDWMDTTFSNEPLIATDFNFSWQFDLAYAVTRSYTASNIFPSNLWLKYQNPLSIEDELTGADLEYWYQYLVGAGGISGSTPFILRKRWVDTLWNPTLSFVPSPFIPQDIASWSYDLYVCGSEGKIFNSADLGDSWTEQYTGITETLNAIDFLNDSLGYSVGMNGTILFTSNGGISLVKEIELPFGFQLFQNYPNPFNPSTNIKFSIAKQDIVSLKVYDVLGQEIETLINEEKPAGEYEIEFDGNKLSSGVYYYKIIAGRFTDTKKMMLTK